MKLVDTQWSWPTHTPNVFVTTRVQLPLKSEMNIVFGSSDMLQKAKGDRILLLSVQGEVLGRQLKLLLPSYWYKT